MHVDKHAWGLQGSELPRREPLKINVNNKEMLGFSVSSYFMINASYRLSFSFLFIFIFNCRIIALQCFVGFCHTTVYRLSSRDWES